MPASLTPSIRADILTALPAHAAGADPTDDDLIRAMCVALATARAMAADLAALARAPQSAPVAPVDLSPVLHALAGEPPGEVPEHARRAVDEAFALRRRADAAAAELAEARKALTAAETRGSDRVREAVARAVRASAAAGRVPDDVPAPLRALAQEVADLRAKLDAAEKAAEAAERRVAERALERAEKTRQAAQVTDRERDEWKKKDESYRREIKQLERDATAAKRAKEMVEKEASHRIKLVEQAEHEAQEARAALALAAEVLGLKKGASPETVIARMQERLAAAPKAPPRARASAQARAEPSPQPEPPHVREIGWRDLQPGDLALDRAAYRRLRAAHDDALLRGAADPDDATRRVLWLRVGDAVARLRTDGLWADGVTHADAPSFRGGRDLRDTSSRRALVIAEGVSGDPARVAAAFREFLEQAEAARVLPELLAEHEAPEAERGGMLPTTATTAAALDDKRSA